MQELQEDVDLVFLANPNNPVGNTIEDMLLEKICDRCRGKKITVVIDECFLEFTRKRGFLKHILYAGIPQCDNCEGFHKVICDSRRASWLPYSVGTKSRTEQILNQLPEWNISTIAEAAGLAALDETEYCNKTTSYIEKERAYLKAELEKWRSKSIRERRISCS